MLSAFVPRVILSRRAFTLVELLVAVGITGLLASYMLLYGSTGRQQVVLSVETAKLAQILSRAKSFGISTIEGPASACGYGVSVDYSNQRYSLASYEILPNCRAVYQGGGFTIGDVEVIETYTLPREVRLRQGAPNALTDVLFVPPDPKTVTNISGALSASAAGSLYLETLDQTLTKEIRVNAGGQISF